MIFRVRRCCTIGLLLISLLMFHNEIVNVAGSSIRSKNGGGGVNNGSSGNDNNDNNNVNNKQSMNPDEIKDWTSIEAKKLARESYRAHLEERHGKDHADKLSDVDLMKTLDDYKRKVENARNVHTEKARKIKEEIHANHNRAQRRAAEGIDEL